MDWHYLTAEAREGEGQALLNSGADEVVQPLDELDREVSKA